jgi:hypothetical protein
MITRIPCDKCGAEILPTTAVATGGICMACKQGIRRGKVDRHGRSIEEQKPRTEIERITVASNGHIHMHNDDGSYITCSTGGPVSDMTDGHAFICKMNLMEDVCTKVKNLVLTGNIAAIDKGDMESLMRLWIVGSKVKESGREVSSLFRGPCLADQFKYLSAVLTELAARGFSPGILQQASYPKNSKNSKNPNKHLVLPIIISGFLGLAIILNNMNYSFYVLLRFTVCASFGWWAWGAHKRGHSTWGNIFALTALFYNPFVPLGLEKNWWQVINSLTIGLIIVASAKNKLSQAIRSVSIK